jgi:hypothetical protein
VLPEPEELQALPGARQALQTLLQCLRDCTNGRPRSVDLRPEPATALLDQLLGGRGQRSARAAVVAHPGVDLRWRMAPLRPGLITSKWAPPRAAAQQGPRCGAAGGFDLSSPCRWAS